MEFNLLARIVGYGISSSALLVLNKVCVTAIPNASFLLFIQILSTVILILVYKLSGYARVNLSPGESVIRAYWLVALVFLGTVYSNFQVVHAIGVNAFIVLRCATPILVSFLDFMFLNRQLPQGRSLISLVGIFIMGFAYAYLKYEELVSERQVTEHTSPGFRGLAWSAVWLTCFVVDMIYIKYVVDSHDCTGLERTLYQNSLALPVLLVSLLFSLEATGTVHIREVKNGAVIALGLSCVAGAILSYTGMSLRADLSATSFSILGIVCKMGSAFLNEIFVSKEANQLSLVCIAGVVMSSSIFQQAPLREVNTRVDKHSKATHNKNGCSFGVTLSIPPTICDDDKAETQKNGGSFLPGPRSALLVVSLCILFGLLLQGRMSEPAAGDTLTAAKPSEGFNTKIRLWNATMKRMVSDPADPAKYMARVVDHQAGLFSQIFVALDVAFHDVETHRNTSSELWKIKEYSPETGSGWSEGRFDDIFRPVRLITANWTQEESYFTRVRRLAKHVLLLHSEIEHALNHYKKILRMDSNSTACLHVRRGDKREGILRITNNDIATALTRSGYEFDSVYILSDDPELPDALNRELPNNISVIKSPETLCATELKFAAPKCFVMSVFLAFDSCKIFLGSSTSNLSRLIMLMGEMPFIDFDGVLDYFSTFIHGVWYKLPDHCYVVEGSLPKNELCGYLSYRCPHCRRNKCDPIRPCDMPP